MSDFIERGGHRRARSAVRVRTYRRLRTAPLVLLLAAPLLGSPAGADHSWAGLHWARTANPFTLQVGDNVSGTWDSSLTGASGDWSASTVLDTVVVPGRSNVRRCSATTGRVEVCNSKYGKNGWLGLASVWASNSHITQGTVKLNDTYFNTATYNTSAWRNSVMCQEIGHTLGLGHNDEDFGTTNGTCMDYSRDPEDNQHPDGHDYVQLEAIYGHVDSTTTLATVTGSSTAAGFEPHARAEWGRAIRYDSEGRPVVFVRDLGAGQRVFTFVVWAD